MPGANSGHIPSSRPLRAFCNVLVGSSDVVGIARLLLVEFRKVAVVVIGLIIGIAIAAVI
jgi:hypothetical protein